MLSSVNSPVPCYPSASFTSGCCVSALALFAFGLLTFRLYLEVATAQNTGFSVMQRKHSRHRDRLNAQNCGKSSKLSGTTYLPNALKNCALRRSAHTKYQLSGFFINSVISKGVPCTRWPSFVVLGILKNKLTSRKQHCGSHGAWGNKAGRTIHNKSSFPLLFSSWKLETFSSYSIDGTAWQKDKN